MNKQEMIEQIMNDEIVIVQHAGNVYEITKEKLSPNAHLMTDDQLRQLATKVVDELFVLMAVEDEPQDD